MNVLFISPRRINRTRKNIAQGALTIEGLELGLELRFEVPEFNVSSTFSSALSSSQVQATVKPPIVFQP